MQQAPERGGLTANSPAQKRRLSAARCAGNLRRSFASGMARLGVPIQVTELCLSHKSGISGKPLVRIYQQHDYSAEVKAAFEKWSAHIESPVSEAVVSDKAA